MCGIVGYISKTENPNSLRLGIEALKRLEYRGYDSAGFALWDNGKKEVLCQKTVGRIAELEEKVNGNNNSFSGNPIILHTRWATTGEPSEANAHPHHDCNRNIWLVHNGIIENYKILKDQLEKEGHKFYSQTDTEVIAHLVEKYFQGNLEDAVSKAAEHLKGTYGLVVIAKNDPQKIVVTRLSSPLVFGEGNGEYLIASDPSALIAHTNNVVYLYDKEIAVLTPEKASIWKLRDRIKSIGWKPEEVEKGDYPHFMLKEIMEQPESIGNALRGRLIPEEGKANLGGLSSIQEQLREAERINIVACGTAYYAGLVGDYMLEEYAGIPTEVDYASEFRYKKPVLHKKAAVLAISQSGETADTLAAVKEAKEKGITTFSITNTVGSSVARETEAGIYNHAGPEIGVASTKAFTSQLILLTLVSLFLGRQRQLSLVMGKRIVEELIKLPSLVKKVLEQEAQIKELAQKYVKFNNFLYLGRKYNYPIALEGALKLKEISYIHAEGYSAGEMKHGPIALISEDFPTVAICPSDSVYNKVISNIEEIKARKGPIIAIATEGNEEIKEIVDDVIYIPKTLEMLTPILSVIPLQLFAYHIAALRGCDIDKPRNLAKSVTVE